MTSTAQPRRPAPVPSRLSGLCVGLPEFWQEPAITEKAAWDGLVAAGHNADFVYVGVPWATIIDGVRNDTPAAWRLVEKLDVLKARLDALPADLPRVSVAQHIVAMNYRSLFDRLGITDLFWSHARRSDGRSGRLTLRPFPLFPAQTGSKAEHADLHRSRRWLANFIGAYNPKIYLSDVRARIFDDEGAPGFNIIKRESWHFDRAVYSEQIRGLSADEARLAEERRQKEEYLDAIRGSVFTLCPTGSGPNSIRIYESLALGSIPVVLTRDLAMAGDPALWEAVCLFEEDSADGYARACDAMRAMSTEEIRTRQAAIPALFKAVGPAGFAALIQQSMTSKPSKD
jgi:hypothetical protein